MNTICIIVDGNVVTWTSVYVAARSEDDPIIVDAGTIPPIEDPTSWAAGSIARKLLDELGAVSAVVQGSKDNATVAMLVTSCKARAVRVSVVSAGWTPPADAVGNIPPSAPRVAKLALWAANNRS